MAKVLVARNILKALFGANAVYPRATSPYLAANLYKNKDHRIRNVFYYLKKRGYLNFEKKNHQIYLSLTGMGKKIAGRYSIDDLSIKKPKEWDGKYRIVMFDIPDKVRLKRDVFRGKLKELGFHRLQQSVWAHPYECQKELDLLRDFLGLSSRELILIVGKIENDGYLRKFFKTGVS